MTSESLVVYGYREINLEHSFKVYQPSSVSQVPVVAPSLQVYGQHKLDSLTICGSLAKSDNLGGCVGEQGGSGRCSKKEWGMNMNKYIICIKNSGRGW